MLNATSFASDRSMTVFRCLGLFAVAFAAAVLLLTSGSSVPTAQADKCKLRNKQPIVRFDHPIGPAINGRVFNKGCEKRFYVYLGEELDPGNWHYYAKVSYDLSGGDEEFRGFLESSPVFGICEAREQGEGRFRSAYRIGDEGKLKVGRQIIAPFC